MRGRATEEKKHFFDNPKNTRRFIGAFYLSVILLAVVDLFVHKHPHFPWERYPSFYGVFGLVSCIGLVLAAKHILRKIVKREEDYYD